MIKTETDIRAVYEIFYMIAEKIHDEDYTRTVGITLNRLLTNRISPITKDERERFGELVEITKKIDGEYYPKFSALAEKQKLEAKTQWVK